MSMQTKTLLKQYTFVWQNAQKFSLLAPHAGVQSCQCSVLTWFTYALGARSVQSAVDCIRRDGAVSWQPPMVLALLQIRKLCSESQTGATTPGAYTVFVCTAGRETYRRSWPDVCLSQPGKGGRTEYARALALAVLHPLITARLAKSIAAGDVLRHDWLWFFALSCRCQEPFTGLCVWPQQVDLRFFFWLAHANTSAGACSAMDGLSISNAA